MFFPEKIISIKDDYKVLEIGPGATPFYRSDVFLELKYQTVEERIAQSGHVGVLQTDKPVFFYDGLIFPFDDKEFDYVICSHVLEHVPDIPLFLNELQRVASRGYMEFPTIYYDYVYNFPEHKMLLMHKENVIFWMPKDQSGMSQFFEIQKLFYRSCELEYFSFINDLKNYFFQGFEWQGELVFKKANSISELAYSAYVLENMERKSPISGMQNGHNKYWFFIKKLIKRLM